MSGDLCPTSQPQLDSVVNGQLTTVDKQPVRETKDMGDNSGEATRNNELRRLFGYMGETTVFHGVSKICEATNRVSKVIWSLLFLAAVSVMTVQLSGLFQEYYSWPVKTEVQLGFSSLGMPDVTICNFNPIRRSRVASLSCETQIAMNIISKNCTDDVDTLNNTYEHDVGDYESGLETIDDIEVRRNKIKSALAEEHWINLLEAGHRIEDMLVNCSLNGHRCYADNFTIFKSVKYGNCYTLSLHKYKASRSGPDSGLDLTLNVETEEAVASYTQAYGMYVDLHEPGTRPSPGTEGFVVASGSEVNVGLRVVQMHRLGGKYGKCEDGKDIYRMTNYKYSISHCRDLCFTTLVRKRCKCLTFNDLKDFNWHGGEETMRIVERMCRTQEEKRCERKVHQEILKMTNEGQDSCTCNSPCVETAYTETISSRTWPKISYLRSLEKQVCNTNPSSPKCQYVDRVDVGMESIEERLNGFARLKIYFVRLNYENVTEKPAYDTERFLSDIGGTIGLWIGASILGLCELIELVILLLRHCYVYQKKVKASLLESLGSRQRTV